MRSFSSRLGRKGYDAGNSGVDLDPVAASGSAATSRQIAAILGIDALPGMLAQDLVAAAGAVQSRALGANGNALTMAAKGDFNAVAAVPETDIAPVAIFAANGFGKTGSTFQADSTFPDSTESPSIAAVGSSGFVVAWRGPDGSNDGVYRNNYDLAGTSTGEDRINSTTLAYQILPRMASLAGDHYVAVWQSQDQGTSNPFQVYARLFNAAGPLGAEFKVNTTANGVQPVVAGLANGGFVVAWDASVTTKYQIFDAQGQKVGSEFSISKAPESLAIAALPNGEFVVVINEFDRGRVSAQGFGSDGVALGPSFIVSQNFDRDSIVSVEALAGGGFVVAWQGPGQAANNSLDVYAKVYNSSLTPVGNEFIVNESVSSDQSQPTIAGLPDGGFVIAWQSYTGTATGVDVIARQFHSDGTAAGHEFVVNSDIATQQLPAIEVVGDGLVVVWDQPVAGLNAGTFGQRFAPEFVGLQATEQSPLDLKGSMSIDDPDAGSNVMTVTLSVDYGVLTVDVGSSGATATGTGTATVMIQGTIAEINAMLGSDPDSAVAYTADTDAPPASATLTFTVDDGALTGTATGTIEIAGVDDLPTAAADAAGVDENATVNFSAVGNDTDPDGSGTIQVIQIRGVDRTPGQSIGLASGAVVTLEANGTLTYDPSGRFNHLRAGDTATDSFTYTINGGSQATVTVTIHGVTSTEDALVGDSGDNFINGTSQADYFDLSQGGNDTAHGGDGNDAFVFGAAFTADDIVDGGAGTNDQLGLQGEYSTSPLTLGANSITGIEVIAVLTGFSYDITTVDENVASGGLLKVQATSLAAGQSLHFNGSAESDGAFFIFGGNGDDDLTGGAGDDAFYFGPAQFNSADHINGGAGNNDQLGLDGDYTITLGGNFSNVETVVLLHGPSGSPNHFNVTANDALVGSHQILTIYALQVETAVTFNGSAEQDGAFRIFGGLAGDTIIGGHGDDWIFGGNGGDTLTGGIGNDTFYYDDTTQSPSISVRDTITDFATGDRIDLSHIDAIIGGSDDAFSFIGSAAFSHHSGELRAVNNTGNNWLVSADIDGNGTSDFQIVVTVGDAHAITSADFVL